MRTASYRLKEETKPDSEALPFKKKTEATDNVVILSNKFLEELPALLS
jgi:hypothetical protein